MDSYIWDLGESLLTDNLQLFQDWFQESVVNGDQYDNLRKYLADAKAYFWFVPLVSILYCKSFLFNISKQYLLVHDFFFMSSLF